MGLILTLVFDVGYFDDQQHQKVIILDGDDVNGDDVKAMYEKYSKGKLLCGVISRSQVTQKQERKKVGH